MTGTLQDLERRIESAVELHTVTRTMRGLAAVNLRRYEQASKATNDYQAIVEAGLSIALREGRVDRLPSGDPPLDAPTGMVVFGSNQGLCGPINRQVAGYAAAVSAELDGLTRVAAVGARVGGALDAAGIPADVVSDLPTTVEAIRPRSRQLLERLDAWRAEDGVERVLLVFPHYLGRQRGYEPVRLQLLPTDRDWLDWLAVRRWPNRVLPTVLGPWDDVVGELIRQALFVRLHRSFAETMASVSASRLAAMAAAERNIEERLTALGEQRHRLRHSEITKELLDVVSGFELLEQQVP